MTSFKRLKCYFHCFTRFFSTRIFFAFKIFLAFESEMEGMRRRTPAESRASSSWGYISGQLTDWLGVDFINVFARSFYMLFVVLKVEEYLSKLVFWGSEKHQTHERSSEVPTQCDSNCLFQLFSTWLRFHIFYELCLKK